MTIKRNEVPTVSLGKEDIPKVTIHDDGWPEWDPVNKKIMIQINGFGEKFNAVTGSNAPEERLYQFAYISGETVKLVNVWDHLHQNTEIIINPGEAGAELYKHLVALDPSISGKRS